MKNANQSKRGGRGGRASHGGHSGRGDRDYGGQCLSGGSDLCRQQGNTTSITESMGNLNVANTPPPAPSAIVQRVIESPFPARPGIGKSGKQITVFANHFEVNYVNKSDIYHYDIDISRNGGDNDIPKALCSKVIRTWLKLYEHEFGGVEIVTDDRKNLYCPSQLPFDSKEFKEIKAEEDSDREYTLKVKMANPGVIRMAQLDQLFTGRLNYTPYDAIQALDIAMRHTASYKFSCVGRNFFNDTGSKYLGEGCDLWFGYHQSLRPTQSRLSLNVDCAATAFVSSMPVIDFALEVLNLKSLPNTLSKQQHSALSKAIRGVKVYVTHLGTAKRSYRCHGLSPRSARDSTFQLEDGQNTNVEKYFSQKYHRLQYGSLPCLHVGSLQKKLYMPIEVCVIKAGQKCPRKVSDNQVANMIKFTCTKPQDRKRQIEQKVREANFQRDPKLKAFGLNVNPRMTAIQARILPDPEVSYGKGKKERPRDGAWNMKGKTFFEPRNVASWAVLNIAGSRHKNNLKRFVESMLSQMPSVGMNCPKKFPPLVSREDFPRGTPICEMYKRSLSAAQNTFNARPQFVLVVKADQNASEYGEIKMASDSVCGIVSQCMLAKHAMKCSPQYIANILLKINTKLGGRNAVVSGPLPKVSSAPTIIFGADVTHPSPMDTSRPSIAAVTASMDRFAMLHAASIRKQGHRVEQIEDLQGMAMELLKSFYVNARAKPSRIIFYRDGVSEGQFQMVLNHEITALRKACNALEAGYNPAITFVVVQKRHHTRFFASDSKDTDRSGNVKAGTVIDSGVCHPTEYDFYLMSHSGIQGTSRPSHYHVLFDENAFSPDELYNLTYRLCYQYARCTRSVSMVPSAYYAHLVAARARCFLEDGSDCSSNSSGKGDVVSRLHEVHKNLLPSMYFV